MAEAGVTMMLYVRDGDSGAAAFLGSASDIVVIGPEGDAPPSVVRDIEPLVRAVTGRSGGGAKSRGGPSEPDRTQDASKASGGMAKMALFVIVAAAVAAVLGLVLAG
jgi:hypothetical protein